MLAMDEERGQLETHHQHTVKPTVDPPSWGCTEKGVETLKTRDGSADDVDGVAAFTPLLFSTTYSESWGKKLIPFFSLTGSKLSEIAYQLFTYFLNC